MKGEGSMPVAPRPDEGWCGQGHLTSREADLSNPSSRRT